jgi:hypothetical protein
MKVRRPPDSARQLNYKRIRDRIVQTLRGVVRNRTFPQRTRPQFLRLLWRVRHDGHPLRLGQSLAKGRCMQAEISPDGEQYLTPCTCDSKFFEGKHPALPELASSLFPRGRCALLHRAAESWNQKGRRWQRGWFVLYRAVINDQWVKDNFVTTN